MMLTTQTSSGSDPRKEVICRMGVVELPLHSRNILILGKSARLWTRTKQ